MYLLKIGPVAALALSGVALCLLALAPLAGALVFGNMASAFTG